MIKHRHYFQLLMVLICACFIVSCAPLEVRQISQSDWETPQPEHAGVNAGILSELFDRISAGEFKNIHSLLIVKDGELIFEEYFPGYEWDWDADQFQGEFIQFDAQTIHPLMSVSKVFTSTLVGIAMDNGFIAGLNEQVGTFFPEYSLQKEKGEITLDHLLTMRSGLDWNGIEIPVSTRDERNDVLQMHASPDPIGYVLSKPLVAEPGTSWYYSNGDVALIGEVVRRSTGLRLDQFAEQYLFTPLGITDYRWRKIGETDIIAAGGGLELRPRDMAKLGQLFLNGGLWDGERVISEDWIRASISNHTSVPFDWLGDIFGQGFGYSWWLRSYQTGLAHYESFTSTGWGGQRIAVFPELDMVVIVTGGNYLTEDPGIEILEEFILPAEEHPIHR